MMNDIENQVRDLSSEDSSLFLRQLQDYNLDTPDGWEGEYRDRLIAMLNPLLEGTDYYFKKNTTDTKNGHSKLTELWKTGIKKRRMGFEYKKTKPENEKIHSFFNLSFYNEISSRMDFPERTKFKGNQPYYSWSLIGLWNLICVTTEKYSFCVDTCNDHYSKRGMIVIGGITQSEQSVSDENSKDAGEAIKIEEAVDQLDLHGADREAVVKVRVNQGEFRERLLQRYSKCCLCGVSEPGLLTASHIKPWAVCEADEKLDVDNGFLLCPNHDKLFDQGFISFSDDGQIMISSSLSETNRIFLNVDSTMRIILTPKNKEFLDYHRNYIFRD